MSRPFILVIFVATIYLTTCFAQSEPLPNPPVSPLLATPTRHLVPTYTPTATEVPIATPVPAPTVATYARAIKLKPDCSSSEDYIKCHDPILDLAFEYPREWGNITATLSNAVFAMGMQGNDLSAYEYAGYAYEYDFSAHFSDAELVNGVTTVVAIGRSNVFAVGRDGPSYDFGGFDQQDTSSFCAQFSYPNLCRVIKAGVVVAFSFPKAEYECRFAYVIPPPMGWVYINLPKRRLINGFIFAYPLLTLTEEKALYMTLGIHQSNMTDKCNDIQAQKQFDEQIDKLADEIILGNADNTLMEKVNMLVRLANSIEGEETSR